MWLALAGLACDPAAEPPEPDPPAARPDILMIIEDTVRADATGVGGATRPVTPNLDRLAKGGTVWTDAVSPGSWSWPGHASLFTGEPPWVHGAHAAADGRGEKRNADGYLVTLPDPAVPMLAEELAAAGYDTSCVTANPWLKRGIGLDRGFSQVLFDTSDYVVVETAKQVIAAKRERPLFLLVNMMGAHAPLEAPEVPWLPAELQTEVTEDLRPFFTPPRTIHGYLAPTLEEMPVLRYARRELELSPTSLDLIRRVYDAEVWRVDQGLAVLLNAWFGSGRKDDVIAITSDHGEYLGEHHRFDHGRDVHDVVTAVPMVVHAPGRVAAGARIDVPTSSAGLHGTLLEFAGLHVTRGARLPKAGDPVQPILTRAWTDVMWAKHVRGRYTQGYRGYRDGSLMLILADDGTPELFDRVADPRLTTNLASSRPDDVARLRAAAETAFGVEVRTAGAGPMDAETRAALEALGYVEPAP